MKRLLLIFLLFGCSKADDLPDSIEPVTICDQFKTGRYSGRQYTDIPNHATTDNPASREIYPQNDSLVIRWWTSPNKVSYAMISDTICYEMVYNKTNTSCGLQRTVYSFKTISWMTGDSLFEKGTVNYKFWYEGNLLKDMQGTFYSKIKYIDSRTPNRWL